MKAKPLYLINTEDNVVYAYSEFLEKSVSPKFIPLIGDLPPIGMDGRRKVSSHEVTAAVAPELTADQRIERIAACIHMVAKEDISESGAESVPAVERLAGLANINRKEIKAAKAKREEVLKMLRQPPKPKEQEVTDPTEE